MIDERDAMERRLKRIGVASKWSVAARALILVAGIVGLALLGGCRSKGYRMTPILLRSLKMGYKGFLVEYEKPLPETNDMRALAKILLGENERNIQFVEFMESSLDAQGDVVDEWKTPLRLTPIPGEAGHFEFRSAGKDRRFDTEDDLYVRSSDDGGNI